MARVYEAQPILTRVDAEGTPDVCTTCTEHTMFVCGWKVKRWCLIIASLVLIAVGCLVPLVIYAAQNATARACRLTYDPDGAVSEATMLEWTSDSRWRLSKPRYDATRGACVCRDAALDPTATPLNASVVVWIAPADLLLLHAQNDGGVLSAGFVDYWNDDSNSPGQFDQHNHVKVCLAQQEVVDLWGDGACHESEGNHADRLSLFYLGYDGALFCRSYCTPDIQRRCRDDDCCYEGGTYQQCTMYRAEHCQKFGGYCPCSYP
jgi:hypothetical protein